MDRFNTIHPLKKELINVGDKVLLYDIFKVDKDMSRSVKLNYRWLGPFKVSSANHGKGTYELQELDGVDKKGTFAGNRLKKFVEESGYWYSINDKPEKSIEKKEPYVLPRTRQETRKDTRQVVRVPIPQVQIPTLSQTQRDQYIRFEDD
ncbi:uncharacterized protein LY89DRAFT_679019 [Mollisia scopiformis]|uniref:Uncharacterized protein n=1 Tax=Mollisia scopiformis TaxID=149040 RepID=A0A194XU51_MOLSC|nr:uncharacterized protein LY89DRAFT_679019 [Mollisia scopiformis]KUJ23666.1 hypothetical protein LY89DRAFT_679019 [Mollisia scopiformis]